MQRLPATRVDLCGLHTSHNFYISAWAAKQVSRCLRLQVCHEGLLLSSQFSLCDEHFPSHFLRKALALKMYKISWFALNYFSVRAP
jgi:hypothetical protein